MKFSVVINTHRRPIRALAVMETLKTMQSGLHEVDFTVAYDREDHATDDFFTGPECCIPRDYAYVADERPRPVSLQDVWNRNLVAPRTYDFYLPMPDDGFCAAPNWDEAIVQLAKSNPTGVPLLAGWNDQANPGQLTVPIVSREWLDLLGPQPLFDPRFPFWFSDTAMGEVWSFVTGRGVPIPQYLLLAGMPGQPNPILRDVDVWWDLYRATRQERLATAARIRDQLGVKLSKERIAEMLREHEARDEKGRIEARKIEAALDKKGRSGPDERYLAALKQAVQYLCGRQAA